MPDDRPSSHSRCRVESGTCAGAGAAGAPQRRTQRLSGFRRFGDVIVLPGRRFEGLAARGSICGRVQSALGMAASTWRRESMSPFHLGSTRPARVPGPGAPTGASRAPRGALPHASALLPRERRRRTRSSALRASARGAAAAGVHARGDRSRGDAGRRADPRACGAVSRSAPRRASEGGRPRARGGRAVAKPRRGRGARRRGLRRSRRPTCTCSRCTHGATDPASVASRSASRRSAVVTAPAAGRAR